MAQEDKFVTYIEESIHKKTLVCQAPYRQVENGSHEFASESNELSILLPPNPVFGGLRQTARSVAI